ncbi:hypothetical protein [Larkinella rosea]|uniref:Lipopolysaccharide biosynthesis protein n=1 Tax=Larkinella rosea TaxID=2025312 RepID=A0A3P1C0N6_9BACT|nr:hypothetical protein [Larkinella rosea]RRB06354.1 hypothetical protein EHT25_00675 [Larkinella rosea]
METIDSRSTDQHQLPPDQISPKEVVNRAIQFKEQLIRSWKVLVVCIILGGIIGFIIDLNLDRRPTYTAWITFNLGGSSGQGGMGELGNIASMFGMGGGAPDANIFTGENFMYYMVSKPIIARALLKEIDTTGVETTANKAATTNKDLMINYYIQHSGIMEDEWEKEDTLRNFRFIRGKNPENFTKLENKALDGIFSRIKGETTITQLDRKSSFLTLRTGMHAELLAAKWLEVMLETVQEDYTEKQSKKTHEMLTLMKARRDSLGSVLGRNDSNLARYIDQNQQIVVAEGQLQQSKLTRNSSFLQSLYYAAVQSVDNLNLTLIKEAPLFTIIEPVSLPLYKESHEPYAMQAGLVVGLMLGLVFIFLKQTYNTIMKS